LNKLGSRREESMKKQPEGRPPEDQKTPLEARRIK